MDFLICFILKGLILLVERMFFQLLLRIVLDIFNFKPFSILANRLPAWLRNHAKNALRYHILNCERQILFNVVICCLHDSKVVIHSESDCFDLLVEGGMAFLELSRVKLLFRD